MAIVIWWSKYLLKDRTLVVKIITYFYLHYWRKGVLRKLFFLQWCLTCAVQRDRTRASTLWFFCLFFSSFEDAKNLLIMGPNNTKNSSKSVIFSYLTMHNIVRILLLLYKKHQIWSKNCFLALGQTQECGLLTANIIISNEETFLQPSAL